MKTITLQGTEAQFSNLDNLQFNYGDSDRLPYEVEIRVYVVDMNNISKELNCEDAMELTNDEFMTEAEKQGTVYSISGFQDAFNFSEVSSICTVIRFISVPLFL